MHRLLHAFRSMRQRKKYHSRNQHWQRQQLPHGEPIEGQIADVGIRHAHELNDKTKQAIKDQKKAGYRHHGPGPGRVKPEDEK